MQIEVKEGLRRLEYGDVAILCRSSTSFAAYENALEHAGIPFLTVAGRGFYGRPEIRDLLNALAALADPTDDLALAGLLRSPALALSDAALVRLCEARARAGGSASLWQTLQSQWVAASGAAPAGEDGGRAARAATLISELHVKAGRAPVADLLKAFLDVTGYRAALVAAGQARAAANVAKLVADAHASGLVSVGEFLTYVAELRDSGTREGEARVTAEGAVQIMSVHAAKGLEFPVVVIGDATYDPPSRRGVLFDPSLGVLLAEKDNDKQVPAIYRLGQLAADDQEAAESDRLLYVAATRAREKLIISGCITAKKDGTPGALGGWLRRLCDAAALELTGLEVTVDETALAPRHLSLTAGASPIACELYGPGWSWERRSPTLVPHTETAVPLPPPLLAMVAAERVGADSRTAEQERDPGQRVWRVVPAVTRPRAPAWVVGKLVHAALAVWRFPDAGGLFPRWAEAHARSYGLTGARQLDDALNKSRTLLLRFQAHPLHAEMTGAERRLHEVPYSLISDDGGMAGRIDGPGHRRVENGIVDALYLRDGVWRIVEFKTDHLADQAALERLLKEEDYLAQAGRYAAAVGRLLGGRPEVILCLLDYVGGVRLERLGPA